MTARRLPDSFGRYYMVRGEAVRSAVQRRQDAGGGAVVIGTDEFSEAMPMAPWREAARWYGVTDACMKRWCREGVVHSSIMDDGRRWVACPWGADSTDWGAVVRYLVDRLGRDGLRTALGKNLGDAKRGNRGEHSDAGNTHLHAWARGDVTPNQHHRQRLRRLFVREKWREAVGG